MKHRARWILWMVVLSTATYSQSQNWSLRVAAWNLLNFGDTKAGLPNNQRVNLLQGYARVIGQYDIILLQEILNNGDSVRVALQPYLPNYNCQTISEESSWQGRTERYSLCYVVMNVPNGPRLNLVRVTDFMAQVNGARVNRTGYDLLPHDPQDIWMRPPLSVEFAYTPGPNQPVYTFSLYVLHVKPAYGHLVRPGIPPNPLPNEAVKYELQALERNIDPNDRLGKWAAIGDFNADCAYFPVRDRPIPFPNDVWYINAGEKTNTARNSSCAYDRIIMNASLSADKIGHGIHTQGITINLPANPYTPVMLNGKKISDHYLIWFEIAGGKGKKRQLVSTTTTVPAAKRAKKTIHPMAKVVATGANLPVPGGTSASSYIVASVPGVSFQGNLSVPLHDVRGAPSRVTIQNDGTFSDDAGWIAQVGAYKLVLDIDSDGVFNSFAGDISSDEIDFVVAGLDYHSTLQTLGERGELRETFSENATPHVYALARRLPPGAQVDAYVIARKLLPKDFVSWDNERNLHRLNLASVAVPVNLLHGPILVPSLTISDKVKTLTVEDDGALFFNAWRHPYVLANMRAWTAQPPVPIYDTSRDNFDDVSDPCENAASSGDSNFRSVCNVGNSFEDYYGKEFNVVIDVNRNGVFDAGDQVDTHDVGDMEKAFGNGTAQLGPGSYSNAVSEYREFLNAKLSPFPALTIEQDYDLDLQQASAKYLCSSTLSKAQFEQIIRPAAQVGFTLNMNGYHSSERFNGGLYEFADMTLDNASIGPNAELCMVGENLELGKTVVEPGARGLVKAENITIQGDVTLGENSTFCMVADVSIKLTGLLTLAAPGTGGLSLAAVPITGGLAAWSWSNCGASK